MQGSGRRSLLTTNPKVHKAYDAFFKNHPADAEWDPVLTLREGAQKRQRVTWSGVVEAVRLNQRVLTTDMTTVQSLQKR